MQRLARLSRLRPAPFGTARPPARLGRGISSGSGPETIRLQRVRFVKAKRGPFRRAFPWICIFLAVYASGFVGIEVVDEEEEEEEEGDDHGDDGDALRSMWFIPFPFTEELHEMPPYPRNSPVNRSYAAVQHDKELAKALQDNLARHVCRVYAGDTLSVRYGRPFGLTTFLNISYPKGPHPQWSQKGIAIGDGAIAWALKQPVSPRAIEMQRNLLWPVPALQAVWTHATTLAGGYVRHLFNWPPPPAVPHNPALARAGQAPSEQRAQVPLPIWRQVPGGPSAGPPSAPPKGGAPLAPPVDGGDLGQDGGDVRPGLSGGRPPGGIDDSRAPASVLRDLHPQAFDRLVHTIRRAWRRKPQPPPPGCIRLNGAVNVWTHKCIIHLNVNAYFDPAAKKFDGDSMAIGITGVAPLPVGYVPPKS